MRGVRSKMKLLHHNTDLIETVRTCLQRGWTILRQMSGDDAYDLYLAHQRSVHTAEPVLSRREFYLWRLELKSRGVNRCC